MPFWIECSFALVGFAFGVLVAALFYRGKLASLKERLIVQEEQSAFLEQSKTQIKDTFKSLSADVLQNSQDSFLKLAETKLALFQQGARADLESRQQSIQSVVLPIQESLEKVNQQIKILEEKRLESYSTLTEQVRSLLLSQNQLKTETGRLAMALRAPNVRGRWGEIQLKRVVEMAGMLEYCDFFEQKTQTHESKIYRPDMVVKLPGGKNIVVDSKAPLQAYLESLEEEDSERRTDKLKEHARHIRNHLMALSQKAYWAQFDPTPEFTILFLPGETFFSAALEQDPALIEFGVNKRVILATPTTLIALLRAVAYGWSQDRIAKNAEEVSHLGKTLYDRVLTLSSHFVDIQKGLDRTVEAYNKSVGSLEGRVLVTMRKFKDLGVEAKEELPLLETVDRNTRALELETFSTPEDVATEKATEKTKKETVMPA